MMLTAFVVAQIVFDVVVVALAALYLLGRKPAPSAAPPDWYEQIVTLAQDLLAATEPVLERLEARGTEAPPSVPEPDRYGEARALLRSGARPDEVAGRAGLLPGEMRLLANIVTAEARGASRAGGALGPASGGA
jgi:hypothetical protein